MKNTLYHGNLNFAISWKLIVIIFMQPAVLPVPIITLTREHVIAMPARSLTMLF